MNASDEHSQSIWMSVDVEPEAPCLDSSESADTVVIGSGIAGLSTAYELAAAGQKVIVLDRGTVGGGMTSRTSAHLAPVCDDSLDALVGLRGEDLARRFQTSQAAAVDRIEEIQTAEEIGCEFRRLHAYLFLAPDTEKDFLAKEFEAAKKVGVEVHRVTKLPFARNAHIPAIRYANQGAFHPLRYLAGLARSIVARGGRIHGDTCVVSVDEGKDGVTVKTANGHTVSAGAAVVATNSPVNDRVALHTKQAPYRSYVMALTIPRDTLPDALYWDTFDPYHYVRLTSGRGSYDYLIVGGGDHKTGEANDAEARFNALEDWVRSFVPTLGKVTHRWSGQVMDTIDYCGFIGRNPGNERIFVATGDSGQGLTHGVVSSLINSSLILGDNRFNTWLDVYDPARKPLAAAKNFVTENVTALKNFAEYLAPGELGSVDQLEPGHGAIIREGLSKVAAYRDENGRLYRVSASCTHVGCHLHWNSFERCWDCPCHGSHFAVDGTALNGPAVAALESLPDPERASDFAASAPSRAT